MRLVLAIVISMAFGFATMFPLKKCGIIDNGQHRCERAKRRGDSAVATLSSRVRYDAETSGNRRFTGEYFDCKYTYKVDGQECTFRKSFQTAEDSMEICYDRIHGNRWIDPERKSVWEYLWALSIPSLFAFLAVRMYT